MSFRIFNDSRNNTSYRSIYFPLVSLGGFEENFCFKFIAYICIFIHSRVATCKFIIESQIAGIAIRSGKVDVVKPVGRYRSFHTGYRTFKAHIVERWFVRIVNSSKSPVHVSGLALHYSVGNAPSPRGSDG